MKCKTETLISFINAFLFPKQICFLLFIFKQSAKYVAIVILSTHNFDKDGFKVFANSVDHNNNY